MYFPNRTQERRFRMSNGDVFKILLTKQVDDLCARPTTGYWIASALFVKNGVVDAHHECGKEKVEAYEAISGWILSNLDAKANIELLSTR
jgi:hypothetical protein